jgi:hypothetical protein
VSQKLRGKINCWNRGWVKKGGALLSSEWTPKQIKDGAVHECYHKIIVESKERMKVDVP